MKPHELSLNDAELLRAAWKTFKDELPTGIEFEVKDRDRFVRAYLEIEEILGELTPGVPYRNRPWFDTSTVPPTCRWFNRATGKWEVAP